MSNDDIQWDAAAEQRLKKAPFFVRKLARKKVENAARELGVSHISVELMEKIKKQEMPGE